MYGGCEELKERTLEKNIDLKSVDLGVQFLDSKRKTAIKEYFPKIGLIGKYVGPEDRFGNKNIWFAGIGSDHAPLRRVPDEGEGRSGRGSISKE